MARNQKRKRKNGLDDNDSSGDDLKIGVIPTPSQLAAEIRGDTVMAIKKKRKSKADKKSSSDENHSQISIKNLPAYKSEGNVVIIKCFWDGPPGQDPVSDDVKQLRKLSGILVRGNLSHCPPPIQSMSSDGVPPIFSKIFNSLNLSKPSAVQMQCWPAILAGANLLCIAPTGSGKTFAYGLPLAPHITQQTSRASEVSKKPNPIGLILVPTRELAIQITSSLQPLRRFAAIRTVAVYGGQDKDAQLTLLQANIPPHIIVATPGRLLDLLCSNKISLSAVTYLVVDEADRMLSMGFEEQLNAISSQIRPDRQAMLFSATFPGRLRDAANRWISEAVTIRINTFEFGKEGDTDTTNEKDDEKCHDNQLPNKEKLNILANIMEGNNTINKSNKGDIIQETACQESNIIIPLHLNHEPVENILHKNISNSNSLPPDGSSIDIDDDNVPLTSVIHSQSRLSSMTISKTVIQTVHICAAHKKPRLLLRFIETVRQKEKELKVRQPGAMIIFCTKIKTLKFVVEFLRKQNMNVEQLHGQLPQQQREANLNNFKAGKLHTLCATDVAARGIHINRLQYVINYDFPTSLEQYCHRVGRTGRQGAEGQAYSLLTRNLAPLAEDLVTLLQSCDQVVEPNLLKLVKEYQSGNMVIDGEEESTNPSTAPADTSHPDDDEEEE